MEGSCTPHHDLSVDMISLIMEAENQTSVVNEEEGSEGFASIRYVRAALVGRQIIVWRWHTVNGGLLDDPVHYHESTFRIITLSGREHRSHCS